MYRKVNKTSLLNNLYNSFSKNLSFLCTTNLIIPMQFTSFPRSHESNTPKNLWTKTRLNYNITQDKEAVNNKMGNGREEEGVRRKGACDAVMCLPPRQKLV